MSPAMRASHLRAAERDKAFTAMHFPSEGYVHVLHDDLSNFCFRHAFVENDPKDPDFIWVFTEHHGFFVFSKDEVSVGESYPCAKVADVQA